MVRMSASALTGTVLRVSVAPFRFRFPYIACLDTALGRSGQSKAGLKRCSAVATSTATAVVRGSGLACSVEQNVALGVGNGFGCDGRDCRIIKLKPLPGAVRHSRSRA
jgi:hypothetical protein